MEFTRNLGRVGVGLTPVDLAAAVDLDDRRLTQYSRLTLSYALSIHLTTMSIFPSLVTPMSATDSSLPPQAVTSLKAIGLGCEAQPT